MKESVHLLLITLFVSVVVSFVACTSQPGAAFTSDKTTITAGESVQFSDLSTNDPTSWIWSFEGGTPSNSPEQDPLVTYFFTGEYSVTLEVKKRGLDDMITFDDYITVLPATTDLTFVNNTHHDVLIIINSLEKTVSPGDQVTYFGIEGNSVDYYAETSGKTDQGNQVGLKLIWDYAIDLTGGAMDYALDIGTDYFFLKLTNNGTHVLNPLVIDHGEDELSIEDVVIPADGVKYSIGYYNAWEYTTVRAYYVDLPGWYTEWNQVDITFENEENQVVELVNIYKKGAVIETSYSMPFRSFKKGTIHHLPNKCVDPIQDFRNIGTATIIKNR